MNIELLNLTHSQGARWIVGAFWTSPTGGALAMAGLMPMNFNLKKLYNHSILRNKTLHYNHPTLSLLEQKNSKGSILHPDALNFLSKTKCNTIKSPLNGGYLQQISETFIPLHDSVKPTKRFVDNCLDKIHFQFPPKNVADHHHAFEVFNLSSNTLHFINGESFHKIDCNVPHSV
jgi:hypothetical protein